MNLTNHLGITIDLDRDKLLHPFGIQTLEDRYYVEGESSPQHAFARAAKAFATDDAHAQRIYDYASKLWFMYSTPILSNGGTTRGLPISCFLNYVPDSRMGLTDHYTENAWLSSVGGGIGGYWGDIRSNGVSTSGGSTSSGAIPFLKVVDAEVLAFSQGGTRRGSYAAYLDISHPEIEEFIEFRKPTGGDANRRSLNLHHGINITDAFMRIIEACEKDANYDDSWDLIDPKTQKVVKTVSARKLWMKILDVRVQTGEPYLHFIDRSNEALPEFQKELGLRVRNSNLCSEITLPVDENRTAVCCLSSVNADTFDEWKDDPLFIRDLVEYLDNVLTFFIDNAPEALGRAAYSAGRERSIGLGLMGFFSYLQKKSIPAEGVLAVSQTHRIQGHVKRKAVEATKELAHLRGACPDALEAGVTDVRNAHLLAIAPNASSGIICGNVSPSCEPYRANAYTQKTKTGSFLMKNPYLEKLLEEKGLNDKATWKSIVTNKGSVQHLDCLTQHEKDVFKTAVELDQRWLIDMASARQQYVCQAISTNLFFTPNVAIPYLHHVHMRAWKMGMKSLYYLRSEAIARAENVESVMTSVKLQDYEECLSCQG